MKKQFVQRAILVVLLLATAGAVWFFFFYESPETQIRNVFAELEMAAEKTGNKPLLDDVADIRAIERLCMPEIQVTGVPHADGTYRAKELAARYVQGRKYLVSMSLSLYDLRITFPAKDFCVTGFSVNASGKTSSQKTFNESFSAVAQLGKNEEGKWVFISISGKEEE